MSWTGTGPTSALWSGNIRTQPITITSNFEFLNVKFLSTTLTTASTINAINVNSSDVNTNTLSTFQVHLSSNTVLTGANASLYINGILVTDASNASNVSQWADFPAIANINANNKNIVNLTSLFGSNIFASNIYNSRSFFGSNINTSTLNVRGQFTGSNITASNITIRNTVSASNGNFTNTSANDAIFVNTTSIFTNTTLFASVNGTITTLSNTNFTSRTANISNFFGKLIRGENLFVSSITTLNNISGASLDVGSITTDTDIYGSNLFVSTIITDGLVGGAIRIGKTLLPVLPWNQGTLYGTSDVISYSNIAGNFIYIATAPSRAQPPTSNIVNWQSGSNYYVGNYGFVEGVGSYRCIQNVFGSTTSPNADDANWTAFTGDRTPTMWEVGASPEETFIGSITGDGFSFITVGTGNFNTLNAPTIVSSNSIHSNIYSYNIYNSNVIDTASLITNTTNTFGETATGILNVINNTTLNTLTTSGAVNFNNTANTNNAFYVNGGMYLNSDIDANTEANIVIGLPPKYLHDINNIRNITVEKITVIGGSTNNTVIGIPVAPFRNNSIVEIGVTEFSPAQVSIYGFNPTGDTTALDVYGEMNVNVGSFNSYYVANFYPVNIEANAINVYGISFLNGGVVITGLLEATGAITVTGLAQLTGDLNVLGLTTLTGETNILGGLTVQAGIGVVGAMFFGEGDFVIGDSGGSAFLNNYNVYIYYNGLNIKNITVNGTGDFRQSVSILGNLTAPTFITSNITASNIAVRTITTSNITASNIAVRTITTSNITASNITVPTITATNIITSNLTATNINFSNITTFTTTNINTSNLTVDTSAIINTQLYLRQNDTLNYAPTLIFENTNTAKSATIELTPEGSLNFNSDDININGNSNLALSANSNVYIASPNPIQVYSQINLKEYPAVNPNPTEITFENEDATKSASIAFNSTSNLLTIQSSNLDIGATTVNIVGTSNVFMKGISSIVLESDDIILNGLSNVGVLSEFGNVLLASVIQTGISGGFVNIQSSCNIDIGASGNIFAQCDGELTLNSFSNTLITATGTIGIGAQGDAQLVSGTGRLILASGGSNNVEINAIGTGSIIANTFGTGGILLYNGSNNGISINNTSVNFGCDGDINLTASNTINLSSTGDTTIIGNDIGIIAQDSLVLSGVTNVTIEAGQVDFIDSSNINFNNTTLSNIGTLYASNATIASISTLRLSTGTLFADSISSINFQASNIQASNIFTSTLRATNTMTASTIAIDRIVGFNSATNIYTNNLFPLSAGAQVGYGPTLAGGGYYNFGFHRSTFTTNINPATDGATTTNNIKVTGHLSTVSLGVSSINFKPYPFISTLNNSVITTTATTTSGTPGLTRLQSNTLRFPFPGTYKVFQEYAISKGSGGGIHGSLIYASNGATATTVANATNWVAQGMSSCPFQDTAGVSTFTTAVTTILANSANLTRDLYYYDSGSGNYTASFYINPPTITYIPSVGIAPEV